MIFGLFKRPATQKPKWLHVGETDIQATPRPIKTAAASIQAYRELLDKAGYFVGDREMRAMATTNFKDDIREHETTLKHHLEAAKEACKDLKAQCTGLTEDLEDATESEEPTQAALDRLKEGQAQLERAQHHLARAKADLDAFKSDRTAFIVALANHEMHETTDPRAHRRD